MKTRRKLASLIAFVILGAALVVHAVGFDETQEVAPMLIPFQGTLNRDGNFLSGPVHLRVSLYDAVTAGNLIWGPEVHDAVQLTDGRFSIVLGSVTAFTRNTLGRKPLFLGFEVMIDGLDAAYVPLLGRQQLLSTPYAVSSRFTTHGVPAGTISAFGGSTAPYGWLLCDGSSLNRVDFPGLFAAIGTAWGTVNSGTFNLPDMRGRFLRGVDRGTGRDPDRGSRGASNANGNAGDNVGSFEGGATHMPNSAFFTGTAGAHSHSFADHYYAEAAGIAPPGTNCNDSAPGGWGSSGSDTDNSLCWEGNGTTVNGDHSHGIGGGDNETRPQNVNVNWIIKY